MSKTIALFLIATLISSSFAMVLDVEGPYKVGKRDLLAIVVPGNPEFSLETAVSERGTLNYPIIGEIPVEGLTVSQIAEKIRTSLIDRKLLLQPTVSVDVKDYRSQTVTILGEIKEPGKIPLKGSEKLLDVIAEAGGLAPSAGEIHISRVTSEGPQKIVIKTSEILIDTAKNNPGVVAGDVIYVRPKETSQIFVSGEVVNEKSMPYVDGMTVYQAIIMAGGITRFGAKNKVKIKRTANGKEEIIPVNLSDIEKGKEKDIALLPNDQVIVGRRIL
jgi:polysaccharide export outer membrane protein